jgi:hypothetical protein
MATSTPNGLKWTPEKLAKSKTTGTYIYVVSDSPAVLDAKGEMKKHTTTYRKITGAPKFWAKSSIQSSSMNDLPNDYLFVTRDDVRVCGNRQDVIAALVMAGLGNVTDISNLLMVDASVVTSSNYETHPVYLTAIANVKSGDDEEKKSNYDFKTIINFAEYVRGGKSSSVGKTDAKEGGAGVSKPGGKSKKTIPLAEKIANLGPDEVLDVSKIKANGSGVTKAKNLPTAKSKKVYSTGMQNLISDNIEAYKLAIELAYGVGAYPEVIREVADLLNRGPGAPPQAIPPMMQSSLATIPGLQVVQQQLQQLPNIATPILAPLSTLR